MGELFLWCIVMLACASIFGWALFEMSDAWSHRNPKEKDDRKAAFPRGGIFTKDGIFHRDNQ